LVRVLVGAVPWFGKKARPVRDEDALTPSGLAAASHGAEVFDQLSK
jgi:hypothetical protein